MSFHSVTVDYSNTDIMHLNWYSRLIMIACRFCFANNLLYSTLIVITNCSPIIYFAVDPATVKSIITDHIVILNILHHLLI